MDWEAAMNGMQQRVGLLALAAVLTAGPAACVSVQVEPLVLEPYPPRAEAPVELEAEPSRAHVKLARLIATSSSADDDALRSKIRSYAGQMGADAVVLGQADVIESNGLGMTYQSTNAPGMGPGSVFGGMGSGMPFFFDPWTYVQAPVDRVDYLQYRSGLAIRYQDGAAAAGWLGLTRHLQ